MAATDSNETKLPQFKVVLIGARGCGKSCLANRFLSNLFTDKYSSSKTTSFSTTFEVDKARVRIDVTDMTAPTTAEQLELLPETLPGHQGIMLVYDCSDAATLTAIKNLFIVGARSVVAAPFVLVGTKGDLLTTLSATSVGSEVTLVQGEAAAEQLGVPFIPTSAKTGQNVGAAFLKLVQQISSHRRATLLPTPVAPAPTQRDRQAIEENVSRWARMWSGFIKRFRKNSSEQTGELIPLPRDSARASVRDQLNDAMGENALSCAINPDDLTFDEGDFIGKGGFGVVRLGTWLRTVRVAVKTINNLPEFTDDQDIEEFNREIRLLSEFRHPNVVNMFGYCFKDSVACLVTEFVTGGDLSKYIYHGEESWKDKYFTRDHIIAVAMSIAKGMIYLHSKSIVHRDLKPGNLLVDNWSVGSVKVCDFGLSSVRSATDDHAATANVLSTPAYTAPELATKTHSFPVDVYSYAIILWELDTAQHAWLEIPRPFMIISAVEQGIRPKIEQRTVLSALIEDCWEKSPSVRPTFPQVYTRLVDVNDSPTARSLVRTASRKNNESTQLPGTGDESRLGAAMDISYAPPLPNTPPPAVFVRARPSLRSRQLQDNIRAGLSRMSAGALPSPTNAEGQDKNISDNTSGATQTVDAAMALWFAGAPEKPAADFVECLSELANTIPARAATVLPFVMTPRETVDFSKWANVLRWFSPLVPDGERNYNGSSAFCFSDMAAVFERRDFHGTFDTDNVRPLLLSREGGTYLIRFSTTPGCFSVSASTGDDVFHWRFVQVQPGSTRLQLGEHSYENLDDVIQRHRPGGLPLRCGSSNETVYLMYPFYRPQQSEAHYSEN